MKRKIVRYYIIKVQNDINPLKGTGVNWLHFAIQV